MGFNKSQEERFRLELVGRKRLEKVLSQGMAVIGGGRAGLPESPPEAEAAVRSAPGPVP